MNSPRFTADAGDVLERDGRVPICACSDEHMARWLADVLNKADARDDLKPLPTPSGDRYAGRGLAVVDTTDYRPRVCECSTPDLATRVAKALNLLDRLEAETAPLTPHERQMLEAALARWNADNEPNR